VKIGGASRTETPLSGGDTSHQYEPLPVAGVPPGTQVPRSGRRDHPMEACSAPRPVLSRSGFPADALDGHLAPSPLRVTRTCRCSGRSISRSFLQSSSTAKLHPSYLWRRQELSRLHPIVVWGSVCARRRQGYVVFPFCCGSSRRSNRRASSGFAQKCRSCDAAFVIPKKSSNASMYSR